MAEEIPYDFTSLQNLFNRPEALNEFAQDQMGKVQEMLRHTEKFSCPPACNLCCQGAILMSYTEFTYIWLYLEQSWSAAQMDQLLRQEIKIMQNESTLRCPFLDRDRTTEHCKIYQARPLICRVFGTTAAPCEENVEPVLLDENLFYRAYDCLYYANKQFIALRLNEDWALFKAPFAFWCLADHDEESRAFLRQFIQERQDSCHAVLYDLQQESFFTLSHGERKIISG